jgi:ABC-type multidrug transport system fused ATPase/permease subunit
MPPAPRQRRPAQGPQAAPGRRRGAGAPGGICGDETVAKPATLSLSDSNDRAENTADDRETSVADTRQDAAFVEFERVQKSYDGETLVVKDLNLSIGKGEFLTMLGP